MPYVRAGVIVGLAGTLSFGLAHALLIVPIWSRLPGGLVVALPCGVFFAWAFDELYSDSHTVRLRDGAAFGAALWVLLLPMTLAAAWLRVTGVRQALGPLEAGLDLAIVGATGFLAAWWKTRRIRASLALLIALVTSVLAMAGPVPVTNGPTEAGLFVSFLPIFLTAGALVAATLHRSVRRQD